MDIELQDQGSKDGNKSSTPEAKSSNQSCTGYCLEKILEAVTFVTGLDKDCFLATVSYYFRLVTWTLFLYFYVGGIGAVEQLFTLRAIIGYILMLMFLVVLRLYFLEYYEILKWFATPSLIFLKSWTSLFFFAYLVLLPADLQSVHFAQIISWIFQVGFGNIVSLALTVMVINIILWIFSLCIPKEDPEPPEEAKKDPIEIEDVAVSKSVEAEEVTKDFKPSTSPNTSIPSGLSGLGGASPTAAAAAANQRRESTMSSLSVGLRTSFAAEAALGRLSLQAYGEAKYLQFALTKGSKHSVDEVGATIHEDEHDKKLVRLSMKQAIYGTYKLSEMTRPVSMMRGNSSGNLAGISGGGGGRGLQMTSGSGNNISGLTDVNRESLVVKRNNTRLVMVHNLDFDGASRGSLSLGGDRGSMSGVTVRPISTKFRPPLPVSPKHHRPLPPPPPVVPPSLGLGPIAGSAHGLNLSLHTTVRPKSSPRSPQSSPSSDGGRKNLGRPLPSVPAASEDAAVVVRRSNSSEDEEVESTTINPLNASTLGAMARPPFVPTLSKMNTIGNLDVIEEGEDEDRATEVSRTQSVSCASGVNVTGLTLTGLGGGTAAGDADNKPYEDDYEMEYPDEALTLAGDVSPQEEEISIALPFIPTMEQLFHFWKHVVVFTALVTYLMPFKTHESVVAFQLACSILAFIISTTYRTALLGKLPLWIQMPLQSFVIFTPIVITIVILSSTEGVHNWQACLQQYIVVPTGIVQDLHGYGAGNFLVLFLNPAIVSLAFSTVDPIIEYFQLLPLMIPAVVISCVIITIQNASISRMLASPAVIASPLLIRTVTIPIAIEITREIHATTGITVATVLVNAVLALRLYPTYLTYMKVNSPVTRGIACGLCGTLLGVVSLDDRGETVAAGIGMAGFGIATISFGLIMTMAAFRDFVCQLS